MIRVTIQKSNNTWKGFTSIGHAGYANSGNDIVCSAVSILLINTINSIEELLPGQEFDLVQNEEDGVMYFKLKSHPNDQTELLLNSMLLGLEQIEKQYKKYVKLKFEEV